MSRILVCDDDHDIVKAICIYLTGSGYETVTAFNGKEAVEKLETDKPDLVILDVMMPLMDGIEALSRIRENSNLPVILLTAKAEDTDKVLGLNLGADDYITKPFNPAELLARVKSALRRYLLLGGAQGEKNAGSENSGEVKTLTYRGLVLDDRKKEVTLDGDVLQLTPTEYDILRLLLRSQGKVFSPKEIVRQVWHEDYEGLASSVPVHIRHLREKIEINPSDPRYIILVWGRGYRLG
ncbi:MAG: response regulator transcription factor [Firmicutes bacterium]|nr:response regulator transcription factor [Bacillota bacterium]